MNLYCAGAQEYFTDGDNFEVENGILKLIADDEAVYERIMDDWADDTPMYCLDEFNGYNKRWFDYTSGMIYSNPTTAGKQITYSYHRNLYCNDNNKLRCIDDQNTGTDMSLDMHTYSVEWDEHKIIWRVDGNEVLIKYKWSNLSGQEMLCCGQIPAAYYSMDRIYPFDDQPMNIIASLGVKQDSPSSFPIDMEIDYIRVYQRINTSNSVKICSSSDIQGSTVAGQDIIVGGASCNITVVDGEYLDLITKNSIVLNSNFSAAAGGHFSMRIDD